MRESMTTLFTTTWAVLTVAKIWPGRFSAAAMNSHFHGAAELDGPPTETDQLCESRLGSFYVPRDEAFEEAKQSALEAAQLRALLRNLIPAASDFLAGGGAPFASFSEVDALYSDGFLMGEDEPKWFAHQILANIWNSWQRMMRFDTPAVIKGDRFSWLRDGEFARQMLAGVNPVNIELLRELPISSKLDPDVYGPPESALTKEVIERDLLEMSLEEAFEEKRLFILELYQILPFVNKMNSLPGIKTYASRTVFYLSNAGVLRPLAIELSLPPTSSSSAGSKRVFTHGQDATTQWMWKLAKAHVWPNDASIHQIVNHLLRTHVCTEPYIIAMHRQLSVMHPIYKLLYPHMRYTLAVNAFARKNLISGGGIIEASYSPGKYAMGLSSAAYKTMWRFDMDALPADLLQRGMAVQDPCMPSGVKLVIEDYPYASDGLLIWQAIKELAEAYVEHFYCEPNSVKSDLELQAWWDEILNIGHADKRNEPWWPKLHTNEDLSSILTTMIWTTSGQHAAINFGQYPFGGCPLNRPTFMRRLIPQEGEPDYEKFKLNPEEFFLSSLPTRYQASKVMATQESVSSHSPDEEYLGKPNSSGNHWTNDEDIQNLYSKFADQLEAIEKMINLRNKDIQLQNRCGAGVPPYELLHPTSGPGVTGRGIPKSVSA
ncbi:unnamed protein product [Linum tenue]|uniref:Lipoxygenase n=1 Tax=Linum tenue TaxID=586396 RepID=A0AAV0S292_9ROSI|nr:unnamed protein product [Linum tenue]